MADGGDRTALLDSGDHVETRGGDILRTQHIDDANVAEDRLILTADIHRACDYIKYQSETAS